MSLLSAFSQQCEINSDKVALIEGNNQLSYQQLKLQAEQLSSLIFARNPDCQRVIIAIERGIDATIAILSVLGIGACYIPLDIKNPVHRLRYIVNDADAQCVIGKGPCPEWLDKPEHWLDISQHTTIDPLHTWPITVNEQSLAAILYTSGSTGNPKGVALSHKAMGNFADWAGNTFNITEKDNIGSLAPFHFDLSVFDLFTSLNRAATIHFVPGKLTLSPSRLTSWLSEHCISVWYTVPSLLSYITHKGALVETDLSHLRTILFAGEVFSTQQLIKLSDFLPKVDLYNLYGPTETNVCCYWPVDRKCLKADSTIPIGIAACDAKLKIDSETGELLVQSTNNLSGYWQQGKLIPALSSDNYYATGDKVSINNLGEYCYHGRLDRMLKCSGYRVEPAEIEQIILQCPEVKSCAVIGIKDIISGQRLAAAVVLKTGTTLAEIIRPIKQRLPSYMQPSKFKVLSSMPQLSNGKIDYKMLQKQLENT